MLDFVTFIQGPFATNAYLIADHNSKQAAVIDPAWDGAEIFSESKQRGWQIKGIWLTHAHFDHIAGASALVRLVDPEPPIALHPDDLSLYQSQGGAHLFGMQIKAGPAPSLSLQHGQIVQLGDTCLEVRHTPGHTPGHVVYCCPDSRVVFCGDVIFNGSIGRTDLPGSRYAQLLESIHSQILSLPDETRLFSGHGEETTVGQERISNPFLV